MIEPVAVLISDDNRARAKSQPIAAQLPPGNLIELAHMGKPRRIPASSALRLYGRMEANYAW